MYVIRCPQICLEIPILNSLLNIRIPMSPRQQRNSSEAWLWDSELRCSHLWMQTLVINSKCVQPWKDTHVEHLGICRLPPTKMAAICSLGSRHIATLFYLCYLDQSTHRILFKGTIVFILQIEETRPQMSEKYSQEQSKWGWSFNSWSLSESSNFIPTSFPPRRLS